MFLQSCKFSIVILTLLQMMKLRHKKVKVTKKDS